MPSTCDAPDPVDIAPEETAPPDEPGALAEGYGRPPDVLGGMMSADDVADVVLFVLTRPRNHRILETAFRPMVEAAWG